MHYDYKKIYEKNAAFYNARPRAKKLLKLANIALSGTYFAAYIGLLAFVFLSPVSTVEQVKTIAVPALCLIAVAFLRMFIDRPRPYAKEGADIEPLLVKKHRDKESFPSRHLACAVVIAFAFLPYLSWVSGILFAIALALGYVRFALGLHYPSDLIGGMLLGCICGGLTFI